MPIITICTDAPIPTYQGIRPAILSLQNLFNPNTFTFPNPAYTFPPFHISIPSLPTLPSPPFGSFNCSTLHLEQFINELTGKGLLGFFEVVIGKIKAIIGDFPLPKIPGLNIDLFDLLTGDPNDFLNIIHTTPIVFPTYPTNVNIGAMQDLDTLQMLVRNYLKALYDTTIGKLVDLMDTLFPVPPWPIPIPSFPTLPDFAAISALLPPFPTLADLQAFSWPGIPLDLSTIIPNPISPFSQLGSYDLKQGIKILMAALPTFPLTMLLQFLEDIGLSLTFPPVCFPIAIT